MRYKGKPFCDAECLGEYLLDEHEDEIEYNCWKDTPENDRIIAAEEREAIRKDLANEW